MKYIVHIRMKDKAYDIPLRCENTVPLGRKKSLKIGLSTSNPYPNFCLPRFHPISVTDQSPFSSCLLPFISLTSRPSVLTLPYCLLLYIFSLYGAHGVLFLSSLFSSPFHPSWSVHPSFLLTPVPEETPTPSLVCLWAASSSSSPPACIACFQNRQVLLLVAWY